MKLFEKDIVVAELDYIGLGSFVVSSMNPYLYKTSRKEELP
jgi:hypothetical protein